MISPTDLILNHDGSIYHLNLLPDEIADTIILVGDKDRVGLISSLFDKIEVIKEKREFITHTGWYCGERISVISTGIGTDNIDIVINEIDALKNIDLKKFEPVKNPEKLSFIRLGTCGTIQQDIPPGSAILSRFVLGLDNLMDFYNFENQKVESELSGKLQQYFLKNGISQSFYLVSAESKLLDIFSNHFRNGITVTAPGFYAPQGRTLRLTPKIKNFISILSLFEWRGNQILNFEMESSALFALCRLLGHHATTINLVIANRYHQNYNIDYKKSMRSLAEKVLALLIQHQNLI